MVSGNQWAVLVSGLLVSFSLISTVLSPRGISGSHNWLWAGSLPKATVCVNSSCCGLDFLLSPPPPHLSQRSIL